MTRVELRTSEPDRRSRKKLPFLYLRQKIGLAIAETSRHLRQALTLLSLLFWQKKRGTPENSKDLPRDRSLKILGKERQNALKNGKLQKKKKSKKKKKLQGLEGQDRGHGAGSQPFHCLSFPEALAGEAVFFEGSSLFFFAKEARI